MAHRPPAPMEPSHGSSPVNVDPETGIVTAAWFRDAEIRFALSKAHRITLMKQCFASLPEEDRKFFLERGILWGDW